MVLPPQSLLLLYVCWLHSLGSKAVRNIYKRNISHVCMYGNNTAAFCELYRRIFFVCVRVLLLILFTFNTFVGVFQLT